MTMRQKALRFSDLLRWCCQTLFVGWSLERSDDPPPTSHKNRIKFMCKIVVFQTKPPDIIGILIGLRQGASPEANNGATRSCAGQASAPRAKTSDIGRFNTGADSCSIIRLPQRPRVGRRFAFPTYAFGINRRLSRVTKQTLSKNKLHLPCVFYVAQAKLFPTPKSDQSHSLSYRIKY